MKKISFEVTSSSYIDFNNPNNTRIDKPSSYPVIQLVLFTSWNDFGLSNGFYMFYYEQEDKERIYLGEIKVLDKKKASDEDISNYTPVSASDSLDNIDSFENNDTEADNKRIIVLPKSFNRLPDDFISLGSSEFYYSTLRDTFNDKELVNHILSCLNDVAINPSLQTGFLNNYWWEHSLLRNNESERMLRVAQDILNRIDYEEKHKFSYLFDPLSNTFSNSYLLNFDFSSKNPYMSQRVFSIIGKNGVGKTTFIRNFLKDYLNRNSKAFSDLLPSFSIPILITTTIYDSHKYSEIYQRSRNEEKCCCIMEKPDIPSQIKQLSDNLKKINGFNSKENPIVESSLKVLKTMFPNSSAFEADNDGLIQIKDIIEVYINFSSGEKTILFELVSILANIRFDSLLLFDEPEVHLHPNFISQFMNTLFELVDNYKSYAIVVTHSPLIVRELKADCVHIMERDDNYWSARKPSVETLGTNLSTITEEIFQNRDIPLHYVGVINDMKENGLTKEQIVSFLKSGERELSLSVELFIESLFASQD